MPTVLSSPFFFIINCLFTCFDRISALSVKSGCHIMSARGTRNFGIILISSGNRHIFTSMFKCASLVHPVPALPVARRNSKCPPQPLKGIRTLTDSTNILLNMEKTVFIRKRKMDYLELWHFIILKSNVQRMP